MPRTTKNSVETTRKPKSTTKGTARKTNQKIIDKEQAGRYLSRVPQENVFWCNDGVILNDVRELRDALNNMSDQTFSYHDNEIKKDFSVWIRDIIGDEELAGDLEAAKSREEAARIVEKRCSLLVEQAS